MDQQPRRTPQSYVPPPVPQTPPPSPAATAEPPRENLKETIESILVAFILAFVFRAFVVEAFVIPSGSMAPTLLGGHMRFRCDDCGYQFDVNYPARTSAEDSMAIPSQSPAQYAMHCANCGLKVNRPIDDYDRSPTIPVHYGDRILVLKYLYLLQDPKRWDVVVFKTPSGQDRYVTNFIKRLVGKPGETIMLLDGDVYALPSTAGEPYKDAPWQVQTKPKAVQDALWRVVYDNDYVPLRDNFVMPWQPTNGAGWIVPSGHAGRILRFTNDAGEGTLSFNKDANPDAYYLTDWLPYNETKEGSLGGSRSHYESDPYGGNAIASWYVSDVKVQFAYQRKSGDGPLRVSLTKLDDTFTAELTPGRARLMHQGRDVQLRLVSEAQLPTGNESMMVEFTNVDYQVTLRVNDKVVLQTTPQEYAPDLKRLLALHERRHQASMNGASVAAVRAIFPQPRIEISAAKQESQLEHLSLWRDIYYTPHYHQPNNYRAIDHGSPERPIRLASRAADGKPNEYFVLGDNSILSGDARGWTDDVELNENEQLVVQSGRVPERFLLGKAFFVYWPAGYRPLTESAPGIVPNFGEMRFIH